MCFSRLLIFQIIHLVVLHVPKIKIKSQSLDSVQKAVTDAIKTVTEADFIPAVRRGSFAGPSVLHWRDVILKGTLLI
jgi:hypothetical protein